MERSAELERLVEEWFAAASEGNSGIVDERVSKSDGVRLVGSDPDEWFSGAAVAEFLRHEVETAGGDATFSPAGTEAYVEGTVGWATTKLTITLPDGRHVSPRWSSVLHREGDRWTFVQTHASIGVPNSDVGWVYLD